ncbi:MAG: hypothetical protein H0V49_09620 [Nocardioidaceae bacterium]|nr:hypothetical protein [Nocardioidaceae bacterium]
MDVKPGWGPISCIIATTTAMAAGLTSSAYSGLAPPTAAVTQISGTSIGPAGPLTAQPAVAKRQPVTSQLPRKRRVFPGRILVAYYGTAHSSALGVLGETDPQRMHRRLRDAARPFGAEGKEVKLVYELIVCIADATAGSDGSYSHLIPKSYVREYVRAARRNNALLVMDFQPGRATFLSQIRQFRWALKNPFVGVALDPEWRMGPGEVPGQTIGSVEAAEVNRVSRYVASFTRHQGLRQKLFMLHQFRTDMVRNIARVQPHEELAMVQHVDGFGTQSQKLSTYHTVARPRDFHMGFKLFYDEDTDLFRPREVLDILPPVRFVSYQ